MDLLVPDYIYSIKPYTPGKPIEELEREYGISGSIKLASNENPLGPSPLAVKAIYEEIANLNRYPDGGGYNLIHKISENLDVEPGKIVLGNGSDEIIGMLTRAFLSPGDEALIPHPSFLMYEIMVKCSGALPVFVPLKSLSIDFDLIISRITDRTRIIFLCNPNNPTGTAFSTRDFDAFLNEIPSGIIVVMDEAYVEFIRDGNCARGTDHLDDDRPLVLLRTFSKIYGLAGLRIGYGIMPEKISDILNRVRQPFNASLLAQAAATAALDDVGFLKKTLEIVHGGLDFLYAALEGLGIEYFPTQSNFFLVNTKKNADWVFQKMLEKGVIIRSMTSYGYPEYIRVNVGLENENRRFIDTLEEVLEN